jgi:hypothetical protein
MNLRIPFAAAALVALAAPGLARAHCDALDGPVVEAARKALDSGKLGEVLAWVPTEHEGEIRDAFSKARAARASGGTAGDVADRWFFETVVRVHRAGEGAPYTGLKPAGGESDPAVAAADRAIETGDFSALHGLLSGAVDGGLHEHVARLRSERPPGDDVAAGRRWVAAYVPLVHWAKGVHAAAGQAGHGHGHGHADAHAETHSPRSSGHGGHHQVRAAHRGGEPLRSSLDPLVVGE